MGDVYINGEISEIPFESHQVGLASSENQLLERHGYQREHVDLCDAARTPCALSDCLGFWSSGDDFLSNLLTLTISISLRFIHFIEDLVLQDFCRCSGDSVATSSGQYIGSSSHNICRSAYEGCSSFSELYTADTSPRICRGRISEHEEVLLVNKRSGVIDTSYNYRGVPFIFQGLMLPLSGVRLCWRLAFACSRYFFSYIRGVQAQVRR
ncbi:hypothetical protein HS088_TW23G00744 [Tripterygium wilfordii]|uniref:Uncharacterized protein n=1 Tax=Tripterygium wilfordii TaxID=458696 RepID=A0A7J7BWK3_TRIWF|nr:uncharacterized protein LOC119992833 [Tripterygium wilfordii]XP_038695542.1 uncharacterized protein LOC119992833 [Tripterygium wilfordii]XP_038695543.1 uncharacterized protein LOC119992833 [Tripterygium wilfordii]XP_038695544.1 uncharacterized protein LOC119992833 [Tripterygium wilfordii]XP_038695545.1 uncharacterized protein LOC119992833 [Tripterygium wilfordii]XP_038695546.1 uncharacterized protein LOC119992833 [Tripterygium wilfordii]XP_038695547.1 uncharacterized protein LOC119992833 [